MAPPKFSDAILLTHGDLEANPILTNQIATLANAATARTKESSPGVWDDEKWHRTSRRFPDTQSVLGLVSSTGIAAVILDENGATAGNGDGILVEVDGAGGVKKGKVVACAVTVPWGGGWEKEGAATEKGWEFKAVSVQDDQRYLKKGLAVKLLQALEGAIVLKEEQNATRDSTKGASGQKDIVRLWVLAAEDTSGPYWRRRGYRDIRRIWHGAGTWGCKTSFEMTVLQKDLEFFTK